MALITDINTAGASGLLIKSKSSLFQVVIGGTWNGGSVALQRKLSDDSWLTVYTFTENTQQTVETVGSGTYRTNTTQGGSAPSLKADAVFASSQSGTVEAA